MCPNERLRVLARRIAEESAKVCVDGSSIVPELIMQMQQLCCHQELIPYDEAGKLVCSCCSKVFEYKRS